MRAAGGTSMASLTDGRVSLGLPARPLNPIALLPVQMAFALSGLPSLGAVFPRVFLPALAYGIVFLLLAHLDKRPSSSGFFSTQRDLPGSPGCFKFLLGLPPAICLWRADSVRYRVSPECLSAVFVVLLFLPNPAVGKE